jgi:hypothetical protein
MRLRGASERRTQLLLRDQTQIRVRRKRTIFLHLRRDFGTVSDE